MSGTKEIATFLGKEKKVVLKPTVNTSSGNGVMLFELTDEEVYKSGDKLLDGPFLKAYNSDFVIQKVLEQHPYLSQFNETSVNTLRITTYKSVRTGEVSVTYAGIRIGRTGSFVDNAHAGGSLVAIDRQTGQLFDFSYDQYGQRSNYANGIDLTKEKYIIPYWQDVLSFAKRIALQIVPMHLLALDIMIDKDGKPRLIEFNCNAFGFWYPMFVGLDPLGGNADEIIEYCKQIN